MQQNTIIVEISYWNNRSSFQSIYPLAPFCRPWLSCEREFIAVGLFRGEVKRKKKERNRHEVFFTPGKIKKQWEGLESKEKAVKFCFYIFLICLFCVFTIYPCGSTYKSLPLFYGNDKRVGRVSLWLWQIKWQSQFIFLFFVVGYLRLSWNKLHVLSF